MAHWLGYLDARILSVLSLHRQLTASAVSAYTGVCQRTAVRHLKNLRAIGAVESTPFMRRSKRKPRVRKTDREYLLWSLPCAR